MSNDDYAAAYSNYKKNTAPKMLSEQLDKPNIFVGNSISDYEEQKFIKNHFLKNSASYHVACFINNSRTSNETIAFEDAFFLRMGIIPLRFRTEKELINSLNAL